MFNPPIFWQLCHPLCGPQIALGLRDFASETPPCCLLCLGDVGMNQHNLWMESAEWDFFFRSHWGCKHFSAPGGLKQTCVLFLPRKDGILPFWCLCILLYSELGNGNNLLFELSIGYQPPNYHRLLGPNNWSMFSWNIHLPTPNLWQPGRAHPKRPTRLGGESLKDVACQDTLFV